MFILAVGEAVRIEDMSMQDAVHEISEWLGHHSWFSFQLQPPRCGEQGRMAQRILYKGERSVHSFVYTSIITIGRCFPCCPSRSFRLDFFYV